MSTLSRLALALLLAGCAGPTLILPAGSSICTSASLAQCEQLSRVVDELNSPEMNARIRAAQEAR